MLLLLACSVEVALSRPITGDSAYYQTTARFKGESSPITVTIYEDRESSTAVVLLEDEGRQVARATQNLLRLEKPTGVYDVTGDGWPSVVLVGAAGGKTLLATVYGYRDNRLQIIGQWSGWALSVVRPNGKPVISLTPSEQGSLSELYIWTDGGFSRCDECFPEFYKPQIEAQWKALDETHVPPYVFSQACELGATALVYGRNYAEAERLCQMARQRLGMTSLLIPNTIGGSPEVLDEEQAENEHKIDSILKAVAQAERDKSAKLSKD